MIPLAQYLTDRDGGADAGFQSFAPAKPKRAAKPRQAFSQLGEEPRRRSAEAGAFRGLDGAERRAANHAGAPGEAFSGNEALGDGFDLDTEALFAGMEDELRQRVATAPARTDARALQSALMAKAPGIDPAKAIARAHARGLAEGREAALAEAAEAQEAVLAEALAIERESAREAQEAAIAAAREEWAASEGERLAAALSSEMDRLSGALHVTLASVLRPLALNARRRQTIDDLAETIATLAYDGRALSLKASGPIDLLAALETALGERSGIVAFEPDERTPEVRIVCDQSVIETRLAEWRTAIDEALQ